MVVDLEEALFEAVCFSSAPNPELQIGRLTKQTLDQMLGFPTTYQAGTELPGEEVV